MFHYSLKKRLWVYIFIYIYNAGFVQLVGGSTIYEGRVEVYHNESWGTVCGSTWDSQNTAIVCTSLGFSP